jgi:glutathione S-transferase
VALVGSLVLAASFGAARAATVKIWIQDGQAWAKGNLLTAALWIAALAAHLGYDYLIGQHMGLGDATVVLYLAISLAVQWVITGARPAAQSGVSRQHGIEPDLSQLARSAR